MYFLYSAQVVAAMVRSVPRARAGLRRLAASPVPAAPPAPISVWASSMNNMMGCGDDCTSSITCRRRFSNSPFMLAPACSSPTSRVRSCTSLSCGGMSPRTMRWAKPSTTAVLPTPASPTRMGLFCRRRIRMSTTWRISPSRPMMGSIFPARACSVRSVVNCLSASCLPICAGAMAELASPGPAPPPIRKPSVEACPSSGDPATNSAKRSFSISGFILSNSLEIDSSTLRRPRVSTMPSRR